MNILMVVNNKENSRCAEVTLISFLENNKKSNVTVYLFCNEKDILKDFYYLEGKYKSEFVFIDLSQIRDSNLNQGGSEKKEIEIISVLQKYIPVAEDRIMYIGNDVVVDGDVTDFYNTSFEDNPIIACGQTFIPIENHFYKLGSFPEKGECFDTSILLINLAEINEISQETIKNAKDFILSSECKLTEQALLNVLFSKRITYADAWLWNCRIELMEDHIKKGYQLPKTKPIIFHFSGTNDYLQDGKIDGSPWIITFSDEELERLYSCGLFFHPFCFRKAREISATMYKNWWKYASLANCCLSLKAEMEGRKKELLGSILPNSGTEERYKQAKNHIFEFGKRLLKNDFSEIDSSIMYDDLERYIDELETTDAIRAMKNLFKYNTERLKNKEIIRVAFLVYSSSEWQCEDIYRLLEKDEKFEPSIVVCAYNHGTEESIHNTYVSTCKFFRTGNYRVEYVGDVNRRVENHRLDNYDIVFYFIHYRYGMIPYGANLIRRSIKQLMIHIPYGFYLVNPRDNYRAISPIFKLSWKAYASSKQELEVAVKSDSLKGYNAIYSGLPKCDRLYEKNKNLDADIWKMKESTIKRIIWAPHFNIAKGMNGTFQKNYIWFYEYAKKHQEISWIVKPHPRMEWGTITYGVFKNHQEYIEYFEKWDSLPNAKVEMFGEYGDIFITSDAMILDSMSFIAEYQYVDKPMLFLQSDTPRPIVSLGIKILEAQYCVNGGDFAGIEQFIENMLIEDKKHKERNKVFEEELNYKKIHQESSSVFIYKDINQSIYGNFVIK